MSDEFKKLDKTIWGSIEGDYHWVWWGVFVLCKVVKLGS